jgi:hypothetical protein
MELIDIGLELPVMVADEDFIEYLAEEGHDESIDEVEAAELFAQWMKENCEH